MVVTCYQVVLNRSGGTYRLFFIMIRFSELVAFYLASFYYLRLLNTFKILYCSILFRSTESHRFYPSCGPTDVIYIYRDRSGRSFDWYQFTVVFQYTLIPKKLRNNGKPDLRLNQRRLKLSNTIVRVFRIVQMFMEMTLKRGQSNL